MDLQREQTLSAFSFGIEYGRYYLRIEKQGYLDYIEYFEINDEYPKYIIVY